MLKSLVLAFALVSFPSRGQAIPPDSALRFAEYAYFTSANSTSLKGWVESLQLTEAHRKAILTYLKKNSKRLTAFPEMGWEAGATSVTVGSGDAQDTIDFSPLISEKEININGSSIKMTDKTKFADIAAKIAKAMKKNEKASKTGFAFFGATAFYSFLDHAAICEEQGNDTAPGCFYPTDSAMIRADIGAGKVSQFTCNVEEKFATLKYLNPRGAAIGITMNYRNEDAISNWFKINQLSSIETFQDESITCKYLVDSTKLTSIEKDAGLAASSCNGHTTGEYAFQSHPQKLGKKDKPRPISLIPFPIQRLQDCCTSKDCKKEMYAVAAKTRSLSSVSSSGSDHTKAKN